MSFWDNVKKLTQPYADDDYDDYDDEEDYDDDDYDDDDDLDFDLTPEEYKPQIIQSVKKASAHRSWAHADRWHSKK